MFSAVFFNVSVEQVEALIGSCGSQQDGHMPYFHYSLVTIKEYLLLQLMLLYLQQLLFTQERGLGGGGGVGGLGRII